MGTSAPLLFPKSGGSSPALPHAVSCKSWKGIISLPTAQAETAVPEILLRNPEKIVLGGGVVGTRPDRAAVSRL